MKDIKTKQKVLSIKTKDVKGNVNHFGLTSNLVTLL